MNTKHTPGPWVLNQPIEKIEFVSVPPSENNPRGFHAKKVWVNAGGLTLGEACAFTTEGFINDFNQFEANARLIAAAPELLEALYLLTQSIYRSELKFASQEIAYDRALAAIKKATE